MRRNNYFSLQKINDIPFLLPYGQARCDYLHSVEINEMGELLWNLLEKEMPKKALLQAYLTQPFTKELLEKGYTEATLLEDANEFLNSLQGLGFLFPDEEFLLKKDECTRRMKIANLRLLLTGREIFFSDPLFQQFMLAPETGDISSEAAELRIHFHEEEHSFPEEKALVLHTFQLRVYETREEWLLQFMEDSGNLLIHLNKAGSLAHIYYTKENAFQVPNAGFHAIRFLFLYRAMLENIFAIHSASILVQDKIWIFSGPSGTGKSTHTNLWKKLFDITIFNGDLNLLALTEAGPVVHGLPWCGTSEISHAGTYSLGGIILLSQGSENKLLPLSTEEQILGVTKRFISPTWTEKHLTAAIEFTTKLQKQVQILSYQCTMEEEAALTLYDKIMN